MVVFHWSTCWFVEKNWPSQLIWKVERLKGQPWFIIFHHLRILNTGPTTVTLLAVSARPDFHGVLQQPANGPTCPLCKLCARGRNVYYTLCPLQVKHRHMHTHTRMHACMHSRTHVHPRTHMHARTHICTHICILTKQTCMGVCTHACQIRTNSW